jgi:SAM-dependent methyltransferase
MPQQLCPRGNAAAAARRLEGLVAEHPGSSPARGALGDVRFELGEYGAALECYERVLDADPGYAAARLGLVRCLSRRPALVLRLRSPQRVARMLEDPGIDPGLAAPAAAILVRASGAPLEQPLLLTLLRETALTDLPLEGALTRVRRELCLRPPREPGELGLALAEQCRLNEAAWAVSPEEEARLATAPGWVRAMYDPGAPDPDLAARARRIPALTPVSAGTSAEVRDLYEANPYPRWRRLSRTAPLVLDQYLRLIAGGAWDPPGFLRRPRLLVAGCGTGRDLLQGARTWRPASATGFDISLASLAYAERMAELAGIEVELFHADLLGLDDWDREFDAIVCTGVLHHLDDPLDGWRRLLRLLRPGGVMLVGLYSETARRAVVAARGEVDRLGFPPTREGIRAARAHLSDLPEDHPAAGCAVFGDLYTVSGCRDLLFHVREHRFTLPRVAAALDELGLTFLGFEADPATRRLYATLFGRRTSLTYWDKLEQLYPDTFLGMYQFWCQKTDRAWIAAAATEREGPWVRGSRRGPSSPGRSSARGGTKGTARG